MLYVTSWLGSQGLLIFLFFLVIFQYVINIIVIIIIIIIIINSCYPLGDIGRQQNTAILSYLRPSS